MKIRKGFVSNSSSSSFTVIGLEVDVCKLRKKVEVRNCKCEIENIEAMQYCPKCGKSVMRRDYIWIDEVKDGYLGDFYIDYNEEYDNEIALITLPGTSVSADDAEMSMQNLPDNLYELKSELKTIAETLGVWDENRFGIWCGQGFS